MHIFEYFARLQFFSFFFLMIRRPPRSTLFPTRRSSDLAEEIGFEHVAKGWHFHLRNRIEESVARVVDPYIDTLEVMQGQGEDRKSTRLNSSHLVISYAVFCLKKKNRTPTTLYTPPLIRV